MSEQQVVVVAAFDVDNTLTTRDCVVPFLRRVAGTAGLFLALVRRAHRLAPALARRDRDLVKEIASAAVFAGRPIAEVESAGAAFAEHISTSWLRHDTLAMLRHHRRDGAAVVLVSASYGAYLRPLASHLGVDVLCTELVIGAGGCCTGALDGGNCRGDAKVARLHQWLDAHHGGRASVTLWAYGDSAGDRAMLDDADHPVWVAARKPATAVTPHPTGTRR